MAIDLEALPAIGNRSAEDILQLLAKPFRPELIRSRRIAGRDVNYVPVAAVIERLNRACNSWSFRIVSHETITMMLNRRPEPRETPVFVVTGELEIPELGVRQGLGVQAIDDGGGEDLLKGASSDALKKAAQLFGLWQPPETR
jgi:hypothetical protein